MNKAKDSIKGLVLATGIIAGVSSFVSQLPEAWDCKDASGIDMTEWQGGDIEFPHCDSEYMSTIGNGVHDFGKLIAIGSGTLFAMGIFVGRKELFGDESHARIPSDSNE